MTRSLLLLLLILAVPARAADFADLDWQQKPGAQLPLNAPLLDGDGRPTTLAKVAHGLPLVLAPGYFKCPNLCGVVRDDVFTALDASGLKPDRDLVVALVTIDPTETVADAQAARQSVLDRFPHASFATLGGPATSLDAIAEAAGFRDRFDAATKQFLHPAGVAIASPTGTISSYLLGVGYSAQDLRTAIARADEGLTATAQPIHLFCFTYNPATGRFTVAVTEALRLGAVAIIAAIGLLLFRLSRRRPRL